VDEPFAIELKQSHHLVALCVVGTLISAAVEVGVVVDLMD